jgi:hypothetical protein
VKLPSTVSVGGASVPLTILEAVLKQTGVYAPSRKGRLSVFWGDQVCACACVFALLCVCERRNQVEAPGLAIACQVALTFRPPR